MKDSAVKKRSGVRGSKVRGSALTGDAMKSNAVKGSAAEYVTDRKVVQWEAGERQFSESQHSAVRGAARKRDCGARKWRERERMQ